MNRDWKNLEKHDLKSLDCLNQIVGKNMNIEGASGESSEGSEEHDRENFYHLR